MVEIVQLKKDHPCYKYGPYGVTVDDYNMREFKTLREAEKYKKMLEKAEREAKKNENRTL